MPNFKYVKKSCWTMSEDEIAVLGEKHKAKLAKEREKRQKKEEHIQTICEATGWSKEKAEEELDKARKLGMSGIHYVWNRCWTMDDKEMEVRVAKANENTAKKKEFNKLKEPNEIEEIIYGTNTREIPGIYATQFNIKKICDILGYEIPESCKTIAEEPLTNISYANVYMRAGGAAFIYKRDYESASVAIDKAIRENVKIVFINDKNKYNPKLDKIPHIIIKSPFRDVIKISAQIRECLGIKVVGITGSVGKTTTKDIIYEVVKTKYRTSRSKSNENTIFPILDNMQSTRRETEIFIQEFGIATPSIMPKTVKACTPNISLITNISEPHIGLFHTRENILKEKLQMVYSMPLGSPVFLNYDDQLLKDVKLEEYPIISYATDNKDADYYAKNIEFTNSHISFDIVNKKENRTVKAKVHSMGIHNVNNAVGAYAIGNYLGISDNDIIKGISSFKPSWVRQNIVNVGGYTMYLDCYNTSPVGVVGAVNTLEKIPTGEEGKRIAILCDMGSLGELEEKLHIETGRAVANAKIDIVICFGGKNAECMAREIRQGGIETYYTDEREKLNQWIKEFIGKKDIALFKGSAFRTLHKSIDQVYGTNFHIITDFCDDSIANNFRIRTIWEDDEEHIINDNLKTAALIKYMGNESIPNILDNYNGIPIFSIAENCFLGNHTISKAFIPESISNIDNSAFKNCDNLKQVILPNTLKLIGNAAFMNCSKLEEIVIPEEVIDIGDNAFRNCASLRKVSIPESIGKIGENAFADCPYVEIETYKKCVCK